ncbi:MAG: glutamine-synthetase adenylyltransferase [Pseudomonadota bacterium]
MAPRAFDAQQGADALAVIGKQDPAINDVISGAAGSSPYLASLVSREADWLRASLSKAPETALSDVIAGIQSLDEKAVSGGLRQAKRRAALLIALADLAGVFDLDQTTKALTDLADASLEAALKAALLPVMRRGSIPSHSEDDIETFAGLAVIAMGKMGANELNYSSDIDLICLFDETRFASDDLADARAGFVRATRAMCKILSETTAEGYVFRTDLRLRPDAAVTPVAISMEAAERYYESAGRTWERAAFIKARPAAGDIAAGQRFLKTLEPFVWRRHLDFWAIEDAHAMRLKIRDAKGLHQKTGHLGRDLKLGIGGIREIEFFAQTRQLIAGGRDPGLRSPKTRDALNQLADADWISKKDARVLSDDYAAHRMLEHRVQMVADQQTHLLPKTSDEFDRLAALAGQSTDQLSGEIEARFDRVHSICEGFFAPRPAPKSEIVLPDNSDAITARWPTYPALRSERARQLFERLKPELLARLTRAGDPVAALSHFDSFLAGLPAGVQVFSLFDANPQLLDLVVDIVDTAPGLAGYLARNSGVFETVIGGAFFDQWPGRDALKDALSDRLAAEDDYEIQLNIARVWSREWHFRTGVHHLRGLISGDEAGYQYADLAQAVLEALWPVVVGNFAIRHGSPPGRGAAILGMGSLGAGTLSAASDLDLIVIFDPENVEKSSGQRPLPSVTYYARLTQAFVNAISAATAEGKLYEVDMRLRPSGRQGPVATAWSSFIEYQSTKAWTWEHLALTRARAVAGADRLRHEIEGFRRDLLDRNWDRKKVCTDVYDMRSRLFEAKAHTSVFDVKNGPGGMQDIELLASCAALLGGSPNRAVRRQLHLGAGMIGLTNDQAEALTAAYERQAQIRQAQVLIGGPSNPNSGAEDFLLRTGAASDKGELENLLTTERVASAAAIDAALAMD